MAARATDIPIPSPIGRIMHWLRDWRARQADYAELDSLGEEGLREVAADLGLSSTQLRELVQMGPDSAELMPKLMTALGLEPDVIRHAEPMVYRDLQRVCSGCADKSRCAQELTAGSIALTYREFCPNADTMSALEAERLQDARAAR